MVPRVLVAGLSGGGGKTLVSVGLVAAWRRAGRKVAPFKKGPDYIDAAWLSRAADVPCRNLDAFLVPPGVLVRSFREASAGADVAVIEGNRGLFDGADARGTWSSAELAKLLDAPVLLVVDCAKTTRTAAALVLGCQRMDPELRIGGVVLNRVRGARHERVLREAVETTCRVPVLGAIPHQAEPPFPERHLGLVPPAEHREADPAVEVAATLAERYVDLDGVVELARTAGVGEDGREVETAGDGRAVEEVTEGGGATRVGNDVLGPARGGRGQGWRPVTIGIFRDAAFQFYYPENLEALRREGADLVEISPLRDDRLPDLDALYIGGGFPETLARGLAANRSFRESLRRAVAEGLPVHAECGGAVYLGEKLFMDGTVYAMSAAVPAVFGFAERPDGHGYTVLEAVKPNPFYDLGTEIRGHEFHYTYLQSVIAEEVSFAFRVRRGWGFDGHRDGLCYRNVLACYTHVHALGVPEWAPSLVRAAGRRRADTAMPRRGAEAS